MPAEPTRSGPGPTQSYRGSDAAAPALDGPLPPGLAEHPDYEVVRKLGGGGMGEVYLAHNRLMGRDGVLKVISPQIIERPEALDRFLREIRAVARLRHPNIVSAYTAFRCGDSVVFAMEYVEGLDLARMVKASGPLPVANACHYAQQAALGLQHAFEHGMVHRDIKPGNLMLTRDRDRALIKVLDFGLAKAERENLGRDFRPPGSDRDRPAADHPALTATGQVLGTPGFVAPEQIVDAPGADIRADIYSLGCTLYFLLSGGQPFPGETLYEVLQAHHSIDPRPLSLVRPEVPIEVAAIVARMMAKDPSRRFQTPSEAAEALAPFSKKGEGASRGPGAGAPRVTPTIGDRLGAEPVLAATEPGTDAGGPAARSPRRTVPATLDARRESPVASREATTPAEGAAPGRRARWVWAWVAAGVLALGLGAAWWGGTLRPRTPDPGPLVAPAVAGVSPTSQAPEPPESRGPAPSQSAASVAIPRASKPETSPDPDRRPSAPPPPIAIPQPGVGTPPVSTRAPRPGQPERPAVPGPVEEAERILAEKGLKRSGLVYILADTEDRIAALREIATRVNQLKVVYGGVQEKYEAIQADYQRVDSERVAVQQQIQQASVLYGDIKDPSERARQERERQDRLNELIRQGRDISERLAPLRHQLADLEAQGAQLTQSYLELQAEAQTRVDEALRRYQELRADGAVQAAIHELNKGRARKYALGPIDDLGAYLKAVKWDAYQTLAEKGLILDRRSHHVHIRYAPGFGRDVARWTNQVAAARRALEGGASPLEELREQRKRLESELARTSGDTARAQLVALLKLNQSQINRLAPEEGAEGPGTASDPRGAFVRAVVNLRRAVEDLQSRYKGLEADADVRTALRDLKMGSKPLPPPPELAPGRKELERAEPRVQAMPVPLRKDGDRYRLEATLNDAKVASLVVDPAGESVLTARLASEVGVTVPAEESTVVRTVDGHRVSARRANLRSVRVGRYTATDSPCLVLLDGGADVAPRLGRGFLDRFGGTIDDANGTLILGEVKPSAPANDSHPKTGGNDPYRPPARGTGSDRTGHPPGRARD
jgi:hypothetical protein